MSGRIRGLAAAGCAGVLALGLLAAEVPAAAVAQPGVRAVLAGTLFGVATDSPSDAWAVGQAGTTTLQTLIEHWNGSTWARVPSPSPGTGDDDLNAVAVTSASNAWAVGGANGQPLILRWNGAAWVTQASPALATGGVLAAVTATSATNAWAAGFGGPRGDLVVIEHWNGSRWAQVTSPVHTGELVGMAASSASDVWAVGLAGDPSGPTAALTMHFNGSAWARVPSPNPADSGELLGVAATATSNAWAVSGAAGQGIGTNKTVIDHWNGSAWTRVKSANPNPGGAILFGVAAAAASDAWAVGTDTDFVTSFENTIEHWNGTAWTLSHSPIRDGSLFAVAAASTASAWAVGSDSAGLPLIEHWNGTRWTHATLR